MRSSFKINIAKLNHKDIILMFIDEGNAFDQLKWQYLFQSLQKFKIASCLQGAIRNGT